MKRKIKKILVLAVGATFIAFGFFGLFFPFFQGILFLIIGIFLLSFCFSKPRSWIKKCAEKSPRLIKVIEKTEKWIAKILGEV